MYIIVGTVINIRPRNDPRGQLNPNSLLSIVKSCFFIYHFFFFPLRLRVTFLNNAEYVSVCVYNIIVVLFVLQLTGNECHPELGAYVRAERGQVDKVYERPGLDHFAAGSGRLHVAGEH